MVHEGERDSSGMTHNGSKGGAAGRGRVFSCLIFTAVYALCMGLRVFYFLRAGKSMICEADALEQHINALMAYGKWLRGAFYSISHGGGLLPQSYAFGLGLGGDFYTALQYYGVGEPLNFPVLFMPTKAVYYYYQFLIILRPYLAGLAFIMLCSYRSGREEGGRSISPVAMAAGAIIYSFSGTVLFIGMWNPFFVIPMITLPLMVRGADILLFEGRRAPLMLAVFLAGVSNFYFFYMQVIFLAGYFVLRLFFDERGEGLRARLRRFGEFIVSGAVGVLMGAVLLFPMFLALLDNPRSGGHAIPALYGRDYYLELFKNLVFYIYHPLQDTELCLTFIAVPAVFITLFFAGRFKLSRERCELIIFIIMLIFPAAGFVMSGFSYAINRWCFAIALLMAWIISSSWDSLLRKRHASVLIFALSVCLVLVNVRLADSPEAGDLPNGFVDRTTGQAFLDDVMNNEVNALKQTVIYDGDDFARYGGRNLVWNAALLHGISSTQFYWSLTNASVAELFSELAVNDMANFSYLGPEDRMILSDLMGVTHYTLRYNTPEEERYIPAGFVHTADHYNFAIWENPLPVGLGAVYDRVMSKDAYGEVTKEKREEVLAGAAVIDSELISEAYETGIEVINAEDIDFSVRYAEFTVRTGDGVSWDAERRVFTVTGDGGEAVIDFDGESASETAILFEGLETTGPEDIVNIGVSVFSEGGEEPAVSRAISYKTPDSEFYSGWHDYLVNFGSAASPFDGAVVRFPAAGEYSVKDIRVVMRPVESWLSEDSERTRLAASALSEVSLHKNPISGTTDKVTALSDSQGPGVLVLSIPWQNGWSARVDGVKTKLFKANTAFIGLFTDAGAHEIELNYSTPGLPAGIVMTLFGIAVFIAVAVREPDTVRGREAGELRDRVRRT